MPLAKVFSGSGKVRSYVFAKGSQTSGLSKKAHGLHDFPLIAARGEEVACSHQSADHSRNWRVNGFPVFQRYESFWNVAASLESSPAARLRRAKIWVVFSMHGGMLRSFSG